jgi:peroxiredoxin
MIDNEGGQRMLEIGTKAPEFTLPDQNGKMHIL